jgi:hypothetical protein
LLECFLLPQSSLTIVLLLELCRWDVADGLEQAAVVEPIDPLEGRVLDAIEVLPGTLTADQLGLVEADDRLGPGRCRRNRRVSRRR